MNKKILALGLVALFLLPNFSPFFIKEAKAATIEEEDTVVPYVQAIVNITYTSSVASASVKTVRTMEIGVIFGPKTYIFERIPPGFMNLPLSILTRNKYARIIPLSMSTTTIEHEEHNTNVNEEWSVDDTNPATIVKYYDNNAQGYKVASELEIDTSITVSDAKYYYLEIYNLETNSTNSDSYVYIGWENATDTSQVVYSDGLIGDVFRDALPVWYSLINATSRPSDTNPVIKKIKLVNINAEKIQVVYRTDPLVDHRDLNITFDVPQLTVSSISFINDFAAQIMKIPNNVKKSWKGTTDAWGWKSLHKTMLKICEQYKQAGETYDYNVKASKLIMKTGKKLAKSIKDEVKKYEDTAKATTEILDEVKDKTIRTITLAVNIAPEALENAKANTISATTNKKLYDLTHAALASVKESIDSSVEWAVGGVKGLTETATNGVKHFVDGVVGVFNNIKKWLSTYWIPILIIGLLILIIVAIFAIQYYRPKIDVV